MNAIVTGATKGIGWAIARKFAAHDFNLILCSRSEADLKACRKELMESNSKIKVYTKAADLSDKNQTLAFADFCQSQPEKPDVLVNNAGVFLPGEILKEPDGALEQMIETNLYSAYHLSRKLAPAMIQKSHGYIINIASVAGLMAYPNGGSYSISKFAMRGFSMVLREELKNTGVKVTTVLPGATWSHSWAGVDLPEERLMQADDIAEGVWSIFKMSPSAVVEEIVLRPQLGDL